MAMTAKMIKFCQEYCVDLNATQAAIRAGYSEETAASIGSENLRKPDIERYIKQLQADAVSAAKITRERIATEFGKMAFADIRQAYDKDGNLKHIKKIDPNTAAAINSLETDELFEWQDGVKKTVGITRKLKLSSKQAALDSLAKMGGFFAPEKTEITGKNGEPLYKDKSPDELAGMLSEVLKKIDD